MPVRMPKPTDERQVVTARREVGEARDDHADTDEHAADGGDEAGAVPVLQAAGDGHREAEEQQRERVRQKGVGARPVERAFSERLGAEPSTPCRCR